MPLIKEFRCQECGIKQEQYVDTMTKSILCQECGGHATSVISAVTSLLEGVSGDFPGASFKWNKKREQKMKQEQAQGKTAFGQLDH